MTKTTTAALLTLALLTAPAALASAPAAGYVQVQTDATPGEACLLYTSPSPRD